MCQFDTSSKYNPLVLQQGIYLYHKRNHVHAFLVLGNEISAQFTIIPVLLPAVIINENQQNSMCMDPPPLHQKDRYG